MGQFLVVVGCCADTARLRSWRNEPERLADTCVVLYGVARWAALAWIKAFNETELSQSRGLWAVLRQRPTE